ncbi:alpha/beta-hydrolase [Hypoxylon sp. NC0597]|nr:alpha/beta-hydrolase [Hypoxylon sp. NC0597]
MRLKQKAAVLFITSNLIAPSRATSSNKTQSLEWKPCPTWLAPEGSPLRCGRLSVPLDWDAPGKGDINVGVAKLPARDQKNRIGNIFFQPGGPGNQGSLSVANMSTGALQIGKDILDYFDMIGVDLRGTGLSDQVKCDVELFNARLPWYPSDPESFAKRVQHNLELRKSCLEMTGNNLIDYMDSISIAKDYEAVRLALGDEPLNWLGVSYGTQLGSQYAELFPDKIRSMVLDGVVSQSQAQISQFLAGASAADAAFRRFAQWCKGQNATICPAVQDPKNRTIEEIWIDIITQAENTPLRCEEPSCLPASDYSNSGQYGGLAVLCQDWAHHDTTPEDLKLKEILAKSQSPLMKGIATPHRFEVSCIGWPNPVRNPPHAISIPETNMLPKILITDAIYDHATSLVWGMQLREEIGKNRVVMVLKNAGGHPAYEQNDAPGGQTKTAIERYILNLTVPEDGIIFES